MTNRRRRPIRPGEFGLARVVLDAAPAPAWWVLRDGVPEPCPSKPEIRCHLSRAPAPARGWISTRKHVTTVARIPERSGLSRKADVPTSARRCGCVEKGLGIYQIGRVEAFGKPVVDWLEGGGRLGGTAS